MDVEQKLLAALRSQNDHQSLMAVVHHHLSQRLTADEIYDVLEQIWLDFGFDCSNGEGPLRNNLEFVMEKVWFQGGMAKPGGK